MAQRCTSRRFGIRVAAPVVAGRTVGGVMQIASKGTYGVATRCDDSSCGVMTSVCDDGGCCVVGGGED